jgi:hypothetical protein
MENEEYNEENDLFNHIESLPQEVQDVILTFEDETYAECRRLQNELEVLGYTFDWYLTAQPYNLRKMETICE